MLSRHSIKPTLLRSQIRNIKTYKHGSLVLSNDTWKKKRGKNAQKYQHSTVIKQKRAQNKERYHLHAKYLFLFSFNSILVTFRNNIP